MTPPPRHVTLALHPDRRGIGWAAFTGPFSAYDWGRRDAKKNKNETCLSKVEHLLKTLEPETVVLEAYERPHAKRSGRVARLYRAIVALSAQRGHDVVVYSRADVAACFRDVGARTRDEIARAVVRHVEVFRDHLPAPRKPWQAENPRMAIFSAAALVLAHYRLGASSLFEQLVSDTKTEPEDGLINEAA